MRIIYMGTPDFAVPALKALAEGGHEVVLAVSQPDKPKGRHGAPQPTPVKEAALLLDIPVMQPERADEPSFTEALSALCPDAIVVAAYGKLLNRDILTLPRYGCINIHASLLPRWRGAAPIQSAVMAGDTESGVTAMLMNEGLDTGDILLQKRIVLDETETAGSLFERLSQLGGELILETLSLLEKDEITPVPQPKEGVTYAKKLTKEDGLLQWEFPAAAVSCMLRGLSPWPGAYGYLGGKLLKLHEARVVSEETAKLILSHHAAPQTQSEETIQRPAPGTLLTRGDRLFVCCSEGFLELLSVQLEGKKRMQTSEFLRGYFRLIEENGRLQRTKEA